MTARSSAELVRTLREFCGAVYGAQCLVASGERGPRVSVLMRYASNLLDAIDLQLLECGLAPGAPELAGAARLRERFESLLLMLLTRSLRERGGSVASGARARPPLRSRRRVRVAPVAPPPA
jgi:hypothetical protein